MTLTCNQMNTLLPLYVNQKLNKTMSKFVEMHLDMCPKCRAKYETLKNAFYELSMVIDYVSAINSSKADTENKIMIKNKTRSLIQYLSPYIDNELSDEDSLRVKKYIVTNLEARKALDNMYKLKKAIYECFEKSKNQIKKDYSKLIIKRLNFQEELEHDDSALRLIPIVSVLLLIGVTCLFFVV